MSVIDIPVTFCGVSIGDETARIGLKLDRSLMTLESADRLLCNRRIIGRLVLGHCDDAAGQTVLDDVDHVVDGAFDTKGFSVKTKTFATGATFQRNELDTAEFSLFAKQSGRFIVDEVTDIPKPEKDGTREETLPGTLKCEGPWRDVPLGELFDPTKGIWKSLAQADLATVGDLADYTATDKRLTDIEGIGPGKAQEIEDTMLEFWRYNSQDEGEE